MYKTPVEKTQSGMRSNAKISKVNSTWQANQADSVKRLKSIDTGIANSQPERSIPKIHSRHLTDLLQASPAKDQIKAVAANI
jgi:hypothetical protein